MPARGVQPSAATPAGDATSQPAFSSPFVEQPDQSTPPELSGPSPRPSGGDSGPSKSEALSASAVLGTLRELKAAVGELQDGQRMLLERTLPVPSMPVSDLASEEDGSAPLVTAQLPLQRASGKVLSPKDFYTTRFSALQIPVIPITLGDLEIERDLGDERVLAQPVPEQERSDREKLIAGPLPAPPEAPEIAAEPEVTTPLDKASPASTSEDLETSAQEEEPSVSEPSLSQAPPAALPVEPPVEEEEAVIDDPFSSPFFSDSPATPAPPAEPSPEPTPAADTTEPPFSGLEPSRPTPATDQTLSDQIASAKKKEDTRRVSQRASSAGTREGERSAIGVLIAVLLAVAFILGVICWSIYRSVEEPQDGGFLAKISQAWSNKSATPPKPVAALEKPPLFELPAYGTAIPEDDERVTAAAAVAREFADTKSIAEAIPLIQPIERALLENFYEPMVGPTIKLYQARQLTESRTEVDFLVKDYGRPERLMPVIKEGDGPYLINWQTFAECEELTLLSLTQGTLIIDGEVVDSGVVRGWMEQGKNESGDFPIGNYQGFRLQSITEEAVAIAYARKGSPTLIKLVEALANTEIRFQGQPAIRAILRVKRIVEADPESDSPTRLEILEVLATDWRQNTGTPPSADKSYQEEAGSEEPEAEPAPGDSSDLLPPVDGAPEQ